VCAERDAFAERATLARDELAAARAEPARAGMASATEDLSTIVERHHALLDIWERKVLEVTAQVMPLDSEPGAPEGVSWCVNHPILLLYCIHNGNRARARVCVCVGGGGPSEGRTYGCYVIPHPLTP
jgi:hypothetical protein